MSKKEKKATGPALSERERLFIEAYMGEAKGNGAKAVRLAGYEMGKYDGQQAYKLLRHPKIQAAIRERQENDPLVASRLERQHFYAQVMRDETARMADRLKAAELLSRTGGDFVTKVEATIRAESWADLAQSIVDEAVAVEENDPDEPNALH